MAGIDADAAGRAGADGRIDALDLMGNVGGGDGRGDWDHSRLAGVGFIFREPR